mmetsp:Transcript_160896/g.516362  ORF Transcript_160896/g.516362 Transcript_160896/m.516362 type:complete len:231 (-) Transcript_160896:60-752(-)
MASSRALLQALRPTKVAAGRHWELRRFCGSAVAVDPQPPSGSPGAAASSSSSASSSSGAPGSCDASIFEGFRNQGLEHWERSRLEWRRGGASGAGAVFGLRRPGSGAAQSSPSRGRWPASTVTAVTRAAAAVGPATVSDRSLARLVHGIEHLEPEEDFERPRGGARRSVSALARQHEQSHLRVPLAELVAYVSRQWSKKARVECALDLPSKRGGSDAVGGAGGTHISGSF